MPSSGAPLAPPQHSIPRRRLSALFRRASRCRVTLCVAPAGYGKSTALAQFLGRNAPDTAFVTLSERGTGLFSVVREIALALSNLLDRPELTLSAVYDRVSVSTTPEIDLARWLQAHLPERPVTIVVENLGAAAADPQVVRFLDRLVREAASLRWYLVARNAGSLPLPNWMADGLLDLPIDHHALAFTPGDTAALARRYSPMTPAQAGALTARMHGWPLGIAMRLRYGDRFAELAYDRRNTAGAYRALIDACYRACSARERDLLLDTALMNVLDPRALRALGWRDGAATLRRLRSRFPYFFTGGRGAASYDDLCQAYLVERLRDRGAEAFAAAVGRCGRALEKAGRSEQALTLYVQERAGRDIVSLLEREGFSLVDSGCAEAVNDALKVLPHDGVQTNPVTLALRGSYEARLGRYDVAEAWYLHALKASDGAVHDDIAYRYACDLLRRRRADCIPLLEALVQRAHAGVMSANARSALAQAYFLEDRIEEGKRTMREAVAALEHVHEPAVLARTLGRAAYVCLYSGDLYGAAEFGSRAVDLAVPARQYVVAIGALSVLYSVACETGRVDDALTHLLHLGRLSTAAGSLDFELYALAGAYELYAERYDVAGIARCETALASFDLHYDTSTTLDALLPARALQLTWQGEFERAYCLLAPSASQQHGTEWKAQRHAELALYAAACERRSDAEREIEHALTAVHDGRAGTQMATQALILLAVTYSLLGRRSEAERTLSAAEVDTAGFERLARLHRAALELHRRWAGDPNHTALLDAFASLHAANFGGFAKMLEQLPMPVAVRSLLLRARNADDFGSAQLLQMLERYPEVSLAG